MTGRFEINYGGGWKPVSTERVREVASANYEDAETVILHIKLQEGGAVRLSPFSYARYVETEENND